MRIVYVNCRLIRKIVKTAVIFEVVFENALQRCGNKEILLRKAQLLALYVIVGRVKNLADELRFVVRTGRHHIVALRKRLHVEVVPCPGAPKPEHAYALAVRTRNHEVVRYRLDDFRVLVFDVAFALAVPPFADVTAEFYAEVFIRTRHHPNFARIQPFVGKLDLHVVDYFLFEKPVLVAERKAHCGIVERGERIHKARGEPAESSVAQSRVVLDFV